MITPTTDTTTRDDGIVEIARVTSVKEEPKSDTSSQQHATLTSVFPNLETHQCTNCGTTASPVWRKGPLGPKSLCNACGLKWSLGKMPLDEKGTGGPKPTHPYTGPNYRIGPNGLPINVGSEESDDAINALVASLTQSNQAPHTDSPTPSHQQQISEKLRGGTPTPQDSTDVITPLRVKRKSKKQKKICSNCGVTKTPVWRKGPLGTGTLCNACGLKFSLGTILLDPETGAAPGKQGYLEFVSDTSESEAEDLAPKGTASPADSGPPVTPKTPRGNRRKRSNGSSSKRSNSPANKISRRRKRSTEISSHQHQIIAATQSIVDPSSTVTQDTQLVYDQVFGITKKKESDQVEPEAKRRKLDQNEALAYKQVIWNSLIGRLGSFTLPYDGPNLNETLGSESLLYILLFIDDPITLCDCMRVCKFWNNTVKDARLWRHLYSKKWRICNANVDAYTNTITRPEISLDWFKLFQARYNIHVYSNAQQAEFMFKFYIIENNPQIIPCIMDKLVKQYHTQENQRNADVLILENELDPTTATNTTSDVKLDQL